MCSQGGGKSTSPIWTSPHLVEPHCRAVNTFLSILEACIVHHSRSAKSRETFHSLTRSIGVGLSLKTGRSDLTSSYRFLGVGSATMKRIIVDSGNENPSNDDAGAQSTPVSSNSPSPPAAQQQQKRKAQNVLPPELMEILVPSVQVGAVTGMLST